ncbi:transcriptional regulator [Actinomadura cremea]|nr:transcriptional regulator [Actinomadura cremea]
MGKRDLVDPEPGAPLGDSRTAVLEVLRGYGPLGVREAAERTGLHLNTVRFHLDGLAEAGLAERAAEERGRPGRPRALYRAVDADEGVRSYRLLAEILTSLVKSTMPDPARAALEAGRAWGRYLAERPAPFENVGAEEATRRLAAFMSGIGFGTRPEPDPDEPAIRLVHCPFREIAAGNQDVICTLHHGLMQGALAQMEAPLTATGLEPFVEPHLCIARLGPAGETAGETAGGADREAPGGAGA